MAEDHDETSRALRGGTLSVGGRPYRFAVELERLYRVSSADPDFEGILTRFGVEDDAPLADLIEADGRLRLGLDLPLTLGRYWAAIPNLASRPDPLDAAIDVALRALARSSRPDEASIESLVADFPEIESSIREAALLNNALWSTASIRSQLTVAPPKSLPCDFGPATSDGEHRYELRELLGEGAFGQVYLAVDRQLSEESHSALVAIKVLRGTDRTVIDRQRLIDEATKARRVGHPNVVRVLDRGVSDENEDFIVYEHVDGGDLGKWVHRHRKSMGTMQAVDLVSRMARGVHAAHMAGLVHCDLKPNNIMMTEDGVPKVADFGVAVRAGEQQTATAGTGREGQPLGNLAFMSPEQYRMEPASLTIPSDVYALGGVLYWLLTNDLPNGSSPEAIERIHRSASVDRPKPRLRTVLPDADRDLEAICGRALAVSPDERYNSAANLAEDLDHWLRREPIAWTRPSPWRRLRLWAIRKPALAIATGVIIILIVAGGVGLQRLSSVAAERRLEAAVATARADEEQKARAKYYGELEDWATRLGKTVNEGGMQHQLLPQLWVLEWLHEPTILGEGPGKLELWEMRVDICRRLVEEARTEGGSRDVQILFWETALGFWLIRTGEPQEAISVLAANRQNWLAVLQRDDDPWLEDIKAMEKCAQVDLLIGERAEGQSPAASADELAGLASDLEQADRRLSRTEHGSPVHLLILEHLEILYRPAVLNRGERHEAIKRQIEGIVK